MANGNLSLRSNETNVFRLIRRRMAHTTPAQATALAATVNPALSEPKASARRCVGSKISPSAMAGIVDRGRSDFGKMISLIAKAASTTPGRVSKRNGSHAGKGFPTSVDSPRKKLQNVSVINLAREDMAVKAYVPQET
jgi:hypothetical protein